MIGSLFKSSMYSVEKTTSFLVRSVESLIYVVIPLDIAQIHVQITCLCGYSRSR